MDDTKDFEAVFQVTSQTSPKPEWLKLFWSAIQRGLVIAIPIVIIACALWVAKEILY